ncbi:hypothetical protein MWU63_02650 [Pseudohalocynthiibacter sp. F2068]|nr:hypothetical protein [Pseudohalocynthiibacter sp. F2068]
MNDRSTYWSFLEERSHFDELGASIDGSIANHLAPIATLQSDGLLRQRNDNTALAEGLENLAGSIDELSLNIERLGENISDGLSQISVELSEISAKLNRLIEIAETPEQTWAMEQFRISTMSLKTSDTKTAYEFCYRAIYGHTNHTGYPLNPDFFFLLGTIYLGTQPNTPRELLDLDKAQDAFRSALRLYDKKERHRRYQISKLAALALLGLGRENEAEQFLTDRHLLSQDVDGCYLLAKVEFSQGKKQWKKSMKQAAKIDSNCVLLVASDPLFKSRESELEKFLLELRNDLTAPYEKVANEIFFDIEANSDQQSRLKKIPTYHYWLEEILDRLSTLKSASGGTYSILKALKRWKFRPESIRDDYLKFLAELEAAQLRSRKLKVEASRVKEPKISSQTKTPLFSRIFPSKRSRESKTNDPLHVFDTEAQELAELNWQSTILK